MTDEPNDLDSSEMEMDDMDNEDLLTGEFESSVPTDPSRPKQERRQRRSLAHTTAFRAVKARQSTNQTIMQVVANGLTNFASSTGFFVFHVIMFTVWIVWNSRLFGLPQFDPFPFGLLTMIVSLEAIFLSIFVLMSQSRESAIAELREEMTLQVNLKIEEEVTKTLQLVAGIYTRLGHKIGEDPELRQMLQPLDPATIERDLMQQISASIPHFRNTRKH
jgi:uncharacterized membrane protein